jgi:hypothetical protein
MLPIETMLGRLGSRFTVHFLQSQKRGIRLSPLGKHYDRLWDLKLGLEATKSDTGETVRLALPFTKSEGWNIFPEVEQELTMTAVKYRARDRRGFRAEFSFVAPFYPQNESLSAVPYFYIDAQVQAPHGWEVKLVVALSDPANASTAEPLFTARGGVLHSDYKMVPGHWGPPNPTDSLSLKTFNLPVSLSFIRTSINPGNIEIDPDIGEIELSLNDEGQASATCLLATHVGEPILEVRNELHCFKYTEFCDSLDEVLKFAVQNETEIRRKTALFDKILSESSIGKASCDLIAFAFQSFIPNTWWTIPNSDSRTQTSAGDWFSNWEGNCVFHSTVDVEYNLAWVYLLLMPELLEKQINQWRNYIKHGIHGDWLSHDVGGLLGANAQVYPHEMEVEENANFILLVWALWRYSGRNEVKAANIEAIQRLAEYIYNSDTTGDGLPDRGIANTIDDASPAVQYGKKQIYLGVKALCALHVATLMLEESTESTEKYRVRVKLMIETINSAWLDDHFAVCLDRTTKGLVNPWTKQALPDGELHGWNAYSLYTSNGLLYLLATNAPLPEGLNLEHFRLDLLNARRESLIEYGCTHSSADHSNIWISQNLHRDFTGAYLGIDPIGMFERYWAFEQLENSVGRGGCFVDTYGANHLHYYPRGITALGIFPALAGMRFDKVNNLQEFKPVRTPLRVPLLNISDWANEKIAFLEVEPSSVVQTKIVDLT